MVSAIVVGILVAAQSRINAQLSGYVGGGVIAAAISFGTGLVLTGLIVAAVPRVRLALTRRLPDALRSGRIRWWQVLGGLGGAWLVTTQGLVVPIVGVTIFTIAVVAGQVSGSLGVDRAGLSPAGVLHITARRGVAAGIAMAAVVMSGLGHARESTGSAGLVAVLLAVSAGLGISVQQAVNARVQQASGEALAAATVNFIVGTTALVLVTAVCLAAGLLTFGSWPGQWWLYLGGPIGVTFIALAAWAVREIGVLTFGLLSIGGQLVGSVLVDWIAPSGAHGPFDVWQLLAIALVALAVGLAASGSSGPARRSGTMTR